MWSKSELARQTCAEQLDRDLIGSADVVSMLWLVELSFAVEVVTLQLKSLTEHFARSAHKEPFCGSMPWLLKPSGVASDHTLLDNGPPMYYTLYVVCCTPHLLCSC